MTFRKEMAKVLDNKLITNRGDKCDVMVVENSVTIEQQMIFICYCHQGLGSACDNNTYSRVDFLKDIKQA
jgi:hypothetical protein